MVSGMFLRFLVATVPLIASLQAATITVLNNNDSGSGSLQQAVSSVVSGDTIAFYASLNGQTIDLECGVIPILDKAITIDGSSLPNGITIHRSYGKAFAVLGREQHDISGGLVFQSS